MRRSELETDHVGTGRDDEIVWSRWADAALLSALRIEWRTGSEDSALKLYEVLASRRDWSRLFERASVFLASSEIAVRTSGPASTPTEPGFCTRGGRGLLHIWCADSVMP